MHNVHMAQGKPRSMPDGRLHLNNYAHVMSSGMAGIIYERLFTERQQEIVGCALLSLANGDPDIVHFKHNVWRFRKDFLQEHFQAVVYGTCRLLRKSPATMVALAVTQEEMKVRQQVVGWPQD